MTDEIPRPQPTSSVQAISQTASDVVSGLKQQPALLAVVVLNVVAIAIAMWFLSNLASNAKEMRERLFTMIEKCMTGELDGVPRKTP